MLILGNSDINTNLLPWKFKIHLYVFLSGSSYDLWIIFIFNYSCFISIIKIFILYS